MLVLSRGKDDRIVFPTLGITVEILRIEGNRIRLGIDAPQDVPVYRGEIAPPVTALAPSSKDAPGCRSHSVRNRLHKATLGLRLLQRMLDAGNASDVEPTIFRIFSELKSLEDELTSPAGRASPEPSAPSAGPIAKNVRALVVEDDPNENQLLASYLRLSGFDVDTAMDGLQAMVHLSKHERPDVVLLDMKMPRFDGPKTVSAIRENPDYQLLKLFAVTGTDQAEAEVALGPRGVDRWFSKPVDPEELVHAIRMELCGIAVPA